MGPLKAMPVLWLRQESSPSQSRHSFNKACINSFQYKVYIQVYCIDLKETHCSKYFWVAYDRERRVLCKPVWLKRKYFRLFYRTLMKIGQSLRNLYYDEFRFSLSSVSLLRVESCCAERQLVGTQRCAAIGRARPSQQRDARRTVTLSAPHIGGG